MLTRDLQLNASQIGQNIFNTSESTDTGSTFTDLWNDVTNTVQEELQDGLNDVAGALGVHDFYSAHVLNYCEGFFTPGAVPNDTLSKGGISRNVTDCSNTTAMYHFNPRDNLQQELDESGVDVDLADLDWPEEIDDGLRALRMASMAMFVLYCIAIALIFIALITAIAGLFMNGRISALLNVVVDLLAFLAIGIASAIVTAIAVKAAHLINRYGNDVGVSATMGRKFMALTWVATACMFVASLVWCFECVTGRRHDRANKHYRGEKYAY